MTECVEYLYADHVARITFTDGGRGNPIHAEFAEQLLAAVLRARADEARVIVLAAEGRFFSVGGDLASLAAAEDPAAFLDDLADSLHRIVAELMGSSAVVVSAVQGTAGGAGFPLAFAADITVAADTATFSLAYSKVGLSPDGGSSLLVHTLGLHRVLRLAILGDLLSAEEAHDAGLLARVVPADLLAGTVEEIVSALLAGSPAAFGAAKRVVRAAATVNVESTLRREAMAIRELAGSAHGREGVKAFLEKRPPVFR